MPDNKNDQNNNFDEFIKSVSKPEVKMPKHNHTTQKFLSPWYNIPFLGIIALFILVISTRWINLFLDTLSLIFILFIPTMLIVYSYGFRGLSLLAQSFFRINTKSPQITISILKDCQKYLIISGWMGFLIGAVQIVNQADLLHKTPADILPVFGVAILTLIYGYFLAYFLIYPTLRRWQRYF